MGLGLGLDAQSLLYILRIRNWMEGCQGHLLQQQSGHSTCWFPPPTRQAAHREERAKISYAEERDTWISGPLNEP